MKRVWVAASVAGALMTVACGGEAARTAGEAAAPAASAPAAGTPAAVDTAGAEAFLRTQLAMYDGQDGASTGAAGAPQTEAERAGEAAMTPAQYADREAAQNAAIYTPALVELMRRDRLTTPQGQIGVLDFQPMCGCNDDSGLRLTGITSTARPDGRVDAVATIATYGGASTFTRRFVLERTPAGWRVADIFSSEPGDTGFLAFMTNGLAQAGASAARS